MVEDGVMTICLQKAKEGETWKGAFEGHILREDIVEEDKKRLLLERFQTEVKTCNALQESIFHLACRI